MRSARRLVLPLALVLAVLSAAPCEATLKVKADSTGLLVEDKNNLDDNFSVEAATQGGNPVFLVTNRNAFDVFKFDRQGGCSQGATSDKVVCSKGNNTLRVNKHGGNDTVRLAPSGVTSTLIDLEDLGPFDNDLEASSGDDVIFTGEGSDTIEGRAGNDEIVMFGTDEPDTVQAGPGNDEVHDLGDFGDTSNASPDDVRGGSGDDVIRFQSAARRTIDGGTGDDEISTGAKADTIDGNAGVDRISSGDGADRITTKEPSTPSRRDTVPSCGLGFDKVTADLKDAVDVFVPPHTGSCEDVDDSAVGETPSVRLLGKALTVSRAGRVRVRMRCPRGVKKLGCKGRLQLTIDRRASASRSRKVRYRIKAGRRKTVTLKLTRRDVRSIRHRGRKARGILTSVEKGRKGRKTTIRNPRLRLR